MKQAILERLKSHNIFESECIEQIQFSPVPKGESGDLAMSFFQLTKLLGKNPVEIAKIVQEALDGFDLLTKTQLAGPYLNLHFAVGNFFESVIKTPLEGSTLEGKNIVLEFSGPNTNKPLHLGHMRNHALAISVSNMLKSHGAEVHQVNIINDRGVHICKSMLAYLKFGEGKTPESEDQKGDSFVGEYYVKFDQASKKDPDLESEIQTMLQQWEAGDPEVKSLWKKMNQWTLEGHAQTYKRQGVAFEKSYFESDYYLEGKAIAEKGLADKVFSKRADGAIVIQFEDENLGEKVILRPDGTSIYLTQDLAVAVARDQDFGHPDELMYTVADEQNYHFKVLFECLGRLNVMEASKCHHLSYGLVNLPDGRMKSREGTVVDADNLMDQLHEIAVKKLSENNTDLSEKEIFTIAEQIQNAAWKFFLLRTVPQKSIIFEAQKSIDFQGATGPYLQYAGVRIKSILSKIKVLDPNFKNWGILGDAEKPLGVKILQWPKVLQRGVETKNPTYLVTYLLELSQIWSQFYAENSIIKAEDPILMEARAILAQKTYDVLEKGLEILGIEIPEKM